MTKDTNTKAKPKQERIKYIFPCACGCGQMSEPLEKSYLRLRKRQKWYFKGCEPLGEKKEFAGGFIIEEDDF